jgi:hypothetical protein
MMKSRNLAYGLTAAVGLIRIAPQGNATCLGTTNFQSPDGRLTARITQIEHTGCGESEIGFVDQSNRVLASSDYRSNDGGHGLIIEKAAWTPDSRFFVFSTYSSGGHQPYNSPIFVFARQRGTIVPLGRVLQGYVNDPDFRIVPPHDIEVSVSDGVSPSTLHTQRVDLEKVAPE